MACLSCSTQAALPLDAHLQLNSYAELVYRNYSEAYQSALALQQQVNQFVSDPGDDADEALNQLRDAWLAARPSYGQSEAFRFYEGPIDCGSCVAGQPGPELLLNSWPLNESYIDGVRGDPHAGIVNDKDASITVDTLIKRNAQDDEADVTTGYHAIEFLLWGQDFNPSGPGNRSARDFIGDGVAARRRTYLQVATDLLVANLKSLVDAWAPNQDNYRQEFLHMSPHDSIAKILTGVATLSGFELGYERLATALDSGSQEDEQSCFSDSTLTDVRANIQGIANVYFGSYGSYYGAGIDSLVAVANPNLNQLITDQIHKSIALADDLDGPFDQTLVTPPGSPQRAKVEALVTSLQTQARLFKAAGSALGVSIVVAVENE